MNNPEFEAYFAKIKTLETMLIAICATMPRESSRQVIELIKAAEANIHTSQKTDSDDHVKRIQEYFMPYLEALRISASAKGNELISASIRKSEIEKGMSHRNI